MDTITVFTFEDERGVEDSFSTQNPIEARDRGRMYRKKVIAHEYEWSDSELAWDFTPGGENE